MTVHNEKCNLFLGTVALGQPDNETRRSFVRT